MGFEWVERDMKAQIKMAETIAVLVVFFFILVFGFTFYQGYQKKSIARIMERNVELQAVQVALKVSFLPELQCSIRNSPTDACIVWQNINAMRELINDEPNIKSHYFGIFGTSEIRIEGIYPDIFNITLYRSALDNSKSKRSTSIPVAVHDAVRGSYNFAAMKIIIYEQ